MKLFLAMAAINDFDLRAIDICAAFLQAEALNREVFIRPPKDVSKDGKVWKLLKPIYGLEDASRKFWLTVRRIFRDEGLVPITGDEAFYIKRENDNLVGCVITHVDDFLISGTPKFITDVTEKVREKLTISKIEDKRFRFTGIDINKTDEGIEISMEDYADSIDEITDIRKAEKSEPLTKVEMKVLRKMTGKVSWLAENCRPDLCFNALEMAKRNGKATIRDLHKVNKVIKKVKGRTSKVF